MKLWVYKTVNKVICYLDTFSPKLQIKLAWKLRHRLHLKDGDVYVQLPHFVRGVGTYVLKDGVMFIKKRTQTCEFTLLSACKILIF